MNNNQSKRIAISLVAAMGIAMASQAALAHGNVDNKAGMGSGMMGQQKGQDMMSGMGQGMMSGMGQGMMGGMGQGMIGGMSQGMMSGMGHGMMSGMGHGMMSGMGHGMTGGMGHGMTGGMGHGMTGGMGHGMMGGKNLAGIDDESRTKINAEMDSLRLKSWEIAGLALKEAPVLRDALSKELPDPAAVGAIYATLFDLKRQIIEAQLSTRNTIKGIVENATKTETEASK